MSFSWRDVKKVIQTQTFRPPTLNKLTCWARPSSPPTTPSSMNWLKKVHSRKFAMTAPMKTDRVSAEMLEMALLLSKHKVLLAPDLGQIKALCSPPPVYPPSGSRKFSF